MDWSQGERGISLGGGSSGSSHPRQEPPCPPKVNIPVSGGACSPGSQAVVCRRSAQPRPCLSFPICLPGHEKADCQGQGLHSRLAPGRLAWPRCLPSAPRTPGPSLGAQGKILSALNL